MNPTEWVPCSATSVLRANPRYRPIAPAMVCAGLRSRDRIVVSTRRRIARPPAAIQRDPAVIAHIGRKMPAAAARAPTPPTCLKEPSDGRIERLILRRRPARRPGYTVLPGRRRSR
jgi:hypothetical protein